MFEPKKIDGQALDQPRQDLWDAANVIREHGLAKHVEFDGKGYCLVGAMRKVMGLANSEHTPRFDKAWELCKKVNSSIPNPVMWNNAPSTTAEDVIQALELAALS